MRIYIASSWKNQHVVELITEKLRDLGHNVVSWVENNYDENHVPGTDGFEFEKWVNSESADKSFQFDIDGATLSDLVIYIAPAGTDAWAEVGAAYGAGIPIIGLWAKGEQSGLIRKMMLCWVSRYTELINAVSIFEIEQNLVIHNK